MPLPWKNVLRVVALLSLALLALGLSHHSGQDVTSRKDGDSSRHAFHNEPPSAPLPPTLDPAQFVRDRPACVSYAIAAENRALLYQEPCYCGCDREDRHESLLDCFTGTHGIRCLVCQEEAIFIREQSRSGATAAEIRRGLAAGEAWKLNFKKYIRDHASLCRLAAQSTAKSGDHP
jgi:hypothetical protein